MKPFRAVVFFLSAAFALAVFSPESHFSRALNDSVQDGPSLESLGGPSDLLEKIRQQSGPRRIESAVPKEIGQRLNGTQKLVLKDAEEWAQVQSGKKHKILLGQFQAEGLSEADMNSVLNYIEHKAPIMIHFRVQMLMDQEAPDGKTVLDGLIRDGEYKNQFQTKTSGGALSPHPGGAHDEVEKILFAGKYNGHPLIPSERIKYGTISLTNAIEGGAPAYGDAYLVLKNHVRERITATPRDSFACKREDLGTLRHFKHVLYRARFLHLPSYSDIVKIARGEILRSDNVDNGWYLEIQIHGPIELNEDVEQIVVNPKYRDTVYERKLQLLAEKYGFPLHWSDAKPRPKSFDNDQF